MSFACSTYPPEHLPPAACSAQPEAPPRNEAAPVAHGKLSERLSRTERSRAANRRRTARLLSAGATINVEERRRKAQGKNTCPDKAGREKINREHGQHTCCSLERSSAGLAWPGPVPSRPVRRSSGSLVGQLCLGQSLGSVSERSRLETSNFTFAARNHLRLSPHSSSGTEHPTWVRAQVKRTSH